MQPRTSASPPLVGRHLVHPALPAHVRLGATGNLHRLLLWWHLVSLDAPTVALLWTLTVASSVHLHLPIVTPVSMFTMVWVLYAADRLLDSEPTRLHPHPLHANLDSLPRDPARGLEARHFIHQQFRTPILCTIAACAVLLLVLVPRLPRSTIHLDLVLGSLLLAYFLAIHATGRAHRLPKEIAVGLFFSAAVFIPTVAREPSFRLHLLPLAVLFAVLCTLNCLWIYRWEHTSQSPGLPLAPPRLTRTLLPYLPLLSLLLASAALLFAVATRQPVPASIALSSLLLFGLHRISARLGLPTLRALADLALLTPLLLWPLLHVA